MALPNTQWWYKSCNKVERNMYAFINVFLEKENIKKKKKNEVTFKHPQVR